MQSVAGSTFCIFVWDAVAVSRPASGRMNGDNKEHPLDLVRGCSNLDWNRSLA
jgi:hypothetical protein